MKTLQQRRIAIPKTDAWRKKNVGVFSKHWDLRCNWIHHNLTLLSIIDFIDTPIETIQMRYSSATYIDAHHRCRRWYFQAKHRTALTMTYKRKQRWYQSWPSRWDTRVPQHSPQQERHRELYGDFRAYYWSWWFTVCCDRHPEWEGTRYL